MTDATLTRDGTFLGDSRMDMTPVLVFLGVCVAVLVYVALLGLSKPTR